jgi:hypothetical protein
MSNNIRDGDGLRSKLCVGFYGWHSYRCRGNIAGYEGMFSEYVYYDDTKTFLMVFQGEFIEEGDVFIWTVSDPWIYVTVDHTAGDCPNQVDLSGNVSNGDTIFFGPTPIAEPSPFQSSEPS